MSNSLTRFSQWAAVACVAGGIVIGLLGRPVIGAEVAALGIIPSVYGMWTGIQSETQGALARSILLFFAALVAAALLVVAALAGWLGA